MLTPQAVVKIIRNGGTRSPAQIKNQWKYISKENTVQLKRPESANGAHMPEDQWEQSAKDWAMYTGRYAPGQDSPNDMTTHIVISFPPGTDPDRAQDAARAWAEKMFQVPDDDGYGGPEDDNSMGFEHGVPDNDYEGQVMLLRQRYEYISAFHTDRDHPHTHIVVNRRGDHGGWLKISKRHPVMNYDNMRRVLVEAAGEHGIEMLATPRSERGLAGHGLTDAQYRRQQRQRAVEVWPFHETDRTLDNESDPSIDLSQDSQPVYNLEPQFLHPMHFQFEDSSSIDSDDSDLSLSSDIPADGVDPDNQLPGIWDEGYLQDPEGHGPGPVLLLGLAPNDPQAGIGPGAVALPGPAAGNLGDDDNGLAPADAERAQARAARAAERAAARDFHRQNPRRSRRLAGEPAQQGLGMPAAPAPAPEADAAEVRRSARIAARNNQRGRNEEQDANPNLRAQNAARENR